MEARHTGTRLLPLLAALLTAAGSARATQPDAPPTNVAAVQRLVADAVGTIVASAHLRAGDTVALALPARSDRWLFEAPCGERLRAAGLVVLSGAASAPVRLELGMASGRVAYGEMFRDGLFGAQRVERTAGATLIGTLARGQELLWSGTVDTLRQDTVEAGDIARLEEGAPGTLKDEPPDETFFDRILEPFVILGATGAAVYLLFHVRS